jgi:hypothetical protein
MDADELARRLSPGRPKCSRVKCSECGALSDLDARGWIAVRAGEADIEDTPKVLFVCPDCAELEFGG